MNIDTVLLIIMTAVAIWTVMGRSLLKAAIGLALTSATITILMFRLQSPLAAVFELSVCTGLITAVFVSTISLTKPLTNTQIKQLSKDRFKRFMYLPVIMAVIGFALVSAHFVTAIPVLPRPAVTMSAGEVLWNTRQLDIFGQIIIVMAGAFGVVMLFKEIRKDGR